ncbi:serine/threonine protein kinase [Parafrankia sp. EAN1pec]|uniref:serine/threonine-protein kinase n=1 Tax=Parafrankia sp. (strain EAN1pec) TaxID=298653 RepID=UPI00015DA1A4|nr:serine/threonine protein kinase [Frankia sp. EAN1pec]
MALSEHRAGHVNLDRAHLEAALPGYAVTRLIASGGFGLVFAGRHLSLNRPVAIKILLPDSDAGAGAGTARAAFAAEARLLERLTHPHIVRVHDYVERNDLCMIVMEYCDGGTLRRRAREGLTAVAAAGVGLAIAAALDLAHQEQVIHRDIKPENILFAGDGTPKVSDFGIAKIVESTGNPTNTVIGTPVYMAPEQFTGEPLRPATDLYSLATVLYELLSGRTPFARQGAAIYLASQHLHEPPPPLGAPTPPEIAAVVMRALHKDPHKRHPTAAAFAADLVIAAAGAFGPGWLDGCTVPLHLADEIRTAAHRGSPRPVTTPPARQTRSPDPLGPSGPGDVSGPDRSPAARNPPALEESDRQKDDALTTTSGPAAVSVLPPSAPVPPAPGTGPAARQRGTSTGKARRGWWPGRRRSIREPVVGPATLSIDYQIDSPFGVAVAPDGALLVSQPLLHRISRVDPGFLINLAHTGTAPGGPARSTTTFAGKGKAGRSGDGGPAPDAELDSPAGIAMSSDGSLLIADCLNDRLRRVSPDGRIETMPALPGLRQPRSVTVDPHGVIYLADTGNHRIWRLDPGDGARVVAGSGTPGYSGDGGPAVHASLTRPQAVAVDAQGRLLIADQEHRRIRRVDTTGRITTIAGTAYGGRPASAGQPAHTTDIGAPTGLAVGPDGVIYLADSANNRVLAIAGDSTVSVLASRSGPVVVADPRQVAVGPSDTVYIAQPGRHRITIIPG